MADILFYTLLLAGAESIEVSIQKAPTLYGMLQKLYFYYRRHIFLFFLVQPGFYTLLFIIIQTDTLNTPMIFLIALKVFDIFSKIELIRQLFLEQKISEEFAQLLEWPMPSWLFALSLGSYPSLLYYALI